MTERNFLSLEGSPIDPADVDQHGLGEKFEVRRKDGTDQAGGKHDGCRYLVLDLDHDPDAQAVARIYASRVTHTRPHLSRDLRAATQSELRPGEAYVDPSEVRLPGDDLRGPGAAP